MNPFERFPSYQPEKPKPKVIGGLYTVRLTLEGMKHSIEQCLLDHDGTLRATVEKELETAIAQFDFSSEIKKVAESAIRVAVNRAIEKAVYDAFTNPGVLAGINQLVMDQLTILLRERR